MIELSRVPGVRPWLIEHLAPIVSLLTTPLLPVPAFPLAQCLSSPCSQHFFPSVQCGAWRSRYVLSCPRSVLFLLNHPCQCSFRPSSPNTEPCPAPQPTM